MTSSVGRQATPPSRISNAPEAQATKPMPMPAPVAGLIRAGIALPGPFAATAAASGADHSGSGDHGDAVARYWLAEDLAGAEPLT